MYSDQYKQEVYKKWVERGRPWFDIDPKKEPTYAERQIILEMKKQEISKPRVGSKPVNEVRAFAELFDY